MSEQITKQAAPWGQILARAVAAARTGGRAAGKGLGRYAQLMAGGDKAVLAKPNQMRQAILKVLGKQNAAQEQFFAAGTQAAGRNAPLTDRQLVIQKVMERLGKKADKMRQRLIPLDVAANREKELVGLARKTTGNVATVAGAGTLGVAIGSRGEQKQAEAYLEGFRKMAEAWGVDPQALMKAAQQTNSVQQTNMVVRPSMPAQKPRKITWQEVQRGQQNAPKPDSTQPLTPVSGPREFLRNIVNGFRKVVR